MREPTPEQRIDELVALVESKKRRWKTSTVQQFLEHNAKLLAHYHEVGHQEALAGPIDERLARHLNQATFQGPQKMALLQYHATFFHYRAVFPRPLASYETAKGLRGTNPVDSHYFRNVVIRALLNPDGVFLPLEVRFELFCLVVRDILPEDSLNPILTDQTCNLDSIPSQDILLGLVQRWIKAGKRNLTRATTREGGDTLEKQLLRTHGLEKWAKQDLIARHFFRRMEYLEPLGFWRRLGAFCRRLFTGTATGLLALPRLLKLSFPAFFYLLGTVLLVVSLYLVWQFWEWTHHHYRILEEELNRPSKTSQLSTATSARKPWSLPSPG